MVTNEIVGLLEGASFDPYIGLFHGVRYGRKSLALDLVEPFRQPLVDNFVLYLLNNRILKATDFERRKNGGMYLSDDARRLFFHAFEERLGETSGGQADHSWRQRFVKQVDSLRNAILGNGEFSCYRVKG